eukprot:COSAG02_NODE_362_length_23815_cov_27.096981_11_plen_184_part_00
MHLSSTKLIFRNSKRACVFSFMFVSSSDHGDFSGNHHLVEKWPGAVDDLLTHVPFVARMPSPEYLPFHKGASPARGHIVEEQIQVFDIMPTALELAGITPNRTHFATSLVPQLMGAKGDPERVVYSDGTSLSDDASKFLSQASEVESTALASHRRSWRETQDQNAAGDSLCFFCRWVSLPNGD